jgi:hypothetical protein
VLLQIKVQRCCYCSRSGGTARSTSHGHAAGFLSVHCSMASDPVADDLIGLAKPHWSKSSIWASQYGNYVGSLGVGLGTCKIVINIFFPGSKLCYWIFYPFSNSNKYDHLTGRANARNPAILVQNLASYTSRPRYLATHHFRHSTKPWLRSKTRAPVC